MEKNVQVKRHEVAAAMLSIGDFIEQTLEPLLHLGDWEEAGVSPFELVADIWEQWQVEEAVPDQQVETDAR